MREIRQLAKKFAAAFTLDVPAGAAIVGAEADAQLNRLLLFIDADWNPETVTREFELYTLGDRVGETSKPVRSLSYRGKRYFMYEVCE